MQFAYCEKDNVMGKKTFYINDNSDEYSLSIVGEDGELTCFAAIRANERRQSHFAIATYPTPEAEPSALTIISPEEMAQIFQKDTFAHMIEALGLTA